MQQTIHIASRNDLQNNLRGWTHCRSWQVDNLALVLTDINALRDNVLTAIQYIQSNYEHGEDHDSKTKQFIFNEVGITLMNEFYSTESNMPAPLLRCPSPGNNRPIHLSPIFWQAGFVIRQSCTVATDTAGLVRFGSKNNRQRTKKRAAAATARNAAI
jgi:hypothetical protein